MSAFSCTLTAYVYLSRLPVEDLRRFLRLPGWARALALRSRPWRAP